jgi:hypothetical protein
MTSLSGCSTWGCAVVGDGVNVCTRFEHDAAGGCTGLAFGWRYRALPVSQRDSASRRRISQVAPVRAHVIHLEG